MAADGCHDCDGQTPGDGGSDGAPRRKCGEVDGEECSIEVAGPGRLGSPYPPADHQGADKPGNSVGGSAAGLGWEPHVGGEHASQSRSQIDREPPPRSNLTLDGDADQDTAEQVERVLTGAGGLDEHWSHEPPPLAANQQTSVSLQGQDNAPVEELRGPDCRRHRGHPRGHRNSSDRRPGSARVNRHAIRRSPPHWADPRAWA